MKANPGFYRSVDSLFVCVLSAMLLFCPAEAIAVQDGAGPSVAGLGRDEALRLGQRMYREGILPSGKPMQAVVVGDIPVDGRMFSCESCHLRSGMGSVEGQVITLPIDGTRLYKPLSPMGDLSNVARGKLPPVLVGGDLRPAYNDEAVATAIRAGEDPLGRKLNEAMPRYFLDDRDMAVLTYYLKNLSVEKPTGVTDTTVRFATVVSRDVDAKDREAMLAPLQFFARTWGRSRRLARKAAKGAFPEEDVNKGYRQVILDVWELQGPPESWRGQLETYYEKEPAFALLGGITTGEWAPIHDFCEAHRMPELFPVTDFPVISADDWYTLYFSRGFYQEGETAANYIQMVANVSPDAAVVQIFRNDRAGLTLAKAFRETSRLLGRRTPEDVKLEGKAVPDVDFWKNLAGRYKNFAVVAWLEPKDLAGLAALADLKERPAMVFVSSGLLGKDLYSLPEKVRNFVYITYPYRLPREDERLRAGVEAWLKNNKIPATNLNIESRMYDLVMMLANPLTMIKGYYYRDHLLELFDMMQDQWYNIALYPRLSFGPGQRYASKGCYVVQLTKGERPELLKRSGWVIH